MTELRQRMVNDMTVRGFAENTKKSYLSSDSRLACHYGRSPDRISAREVQDYLIFLHDERELTWQSCNCIRHGIRFFYRITLGLPEPHFYLPGAKAPSTLPELLNPVSQGNPALIYQLLFRAASQTLLEFGRNPRWLGGELGITMVLHTWGQNVGQHIHVHCIVTDGGLSPDGQRWLSSVRKGFLFPTAALSKVFRGKYLDLLDAAHRDGELRLKAAGVNDSHEFECLKTVLRSHDWVVYSKIPFASAGQVLAYLGRYTHKTAIGNHRLVDFDGEQVRFRWRDYADGNRVKVMRLDADEFIRRFLLHVLPRGFTRLRHYGLLANRCRARKLAMCRALFGQPTPEPLEPETTEEMMLRLTGIDITVCRQCGEGTLRQILILEPRHCTGAAAMKTGPP